jgi:hypothetical protein
MATIDLNLVDRSLQGQEWTAEKGAVTSDDLSKVTEQISDHSGAMNALPTPFARFFVFKEAFRRVFREGKDAGFANTWLVSDCLDLFEILFDLKRLKSTNDIVIKEWSVGSDINSDLHQFAQRSRILGDCLTTYIKEDLPGVDTLHFIILRKDGKEFLLGTSSPYTGFVTPPDMDKAKTEHGYDTVGDRYRSLFITDSKGEAFFRRKEPKLLGERDASFKNYMYNLFGAANVNESLKALQEYIRSFKDDTDINANVILSLDGIDTEKGSELVVNGIKISMNSSKEAGQIFSDCLIKLPYKISDENFKTGTYSKNPEDHGYLLPITHQALTTLDIAKAKFSIKDSPIEVTVKMECAELPKPLEKKYALTPTKPTDGRIIDLSEGTNIIFDMGLFPIVKSDDESANQYFKLMIAAKDTNAIPDFSIDDITCKFYKDKSLIEEATDNHFKSGVRQSVVRTKQSAKNAAGTEFYELFNTDFDILRIDVKYGQDIYSGVLIPNWRIIKNANRDYTYAIDFGTSNTFVSAIENNSDNQPRQLLMSKPVMAFLHDRLHNDQKEEIDLWEDAMDADLLKAFKSEFIPAFIDGNKYRFPLRSVLSIKDTSEPDKILFDNCNIAFGYEKTPLVGDNVVDTDIKWSLESDEIRIFIRELLLIVKSDLFDHGGKTAGTKIIWFAPLSLNNSMRKTYDKIWKEEVHSVLGPGVEDICCSESEAPYYYFNRRNQFTSINSVAIVDIGGGSTDVVYFKDGKPGFANSVHFGCDVLWGNGHNKMYNDKQNGIFLKYKDSVKFDDDELAVINEQMTPVNSPASTKDILNFWISNEGKMKNMNLSSRMEDDFKPVFAYHYASIIFYIAQMIKSRGDECPRVITFSGNGSRYIDTLLSRDEDTLVAATMVIFKHVFGDDIKDIQLILPQERKESTCYGGLYKPTAAKTAEPYYFLGAGGQFKTVADIKKAFDSELKGALMSQIDDFNATFIEMLGYLIRKDNITNINTASIKACIGEKMADYLETDYKKQFDDLQDEQHYNDSLFFMPVIDKIFDLTKLQ